MPNIKPILFNTEMVRAILDSRKTTTRRVIKNGKHTPTEIGREKFYTYVDELNGKPFYGAGFYNDSDIFCVDGLYHTDAEYFKMQYQVGDILYVRETFRKASYCGNGSKVSYLYKADLDDDVEIGSKWHPSIHMPKEAARIFLRVTGVRAERLRDITEKEICKEGLDPYDDRCADENWRPTYYDPDSGGTPQLKQGFKILWDSTIKKQDLDKYGLEANPWVWVIEFERCKKPSEG